MSNPVAEKHNLVLQWLTIFLGTLYGLTYEQKISLGLLVIGLITMLVNWYYKQKHFELEKKKLRFAIESSKPAQESGCGTPE